MCAPQRRVCSWWVVKGAPKRRRRAVRRGVPNVRVRVRERRAGFWDR